MQLSLKSFFLILFYFGFPLSEWETEEIEKYTIAATVKEDVQKYWVVAKTKKPFSMIPIDQAHEQNNAIV